MTETATTIFSAPPKPRKSPPQPPIDIAKVTRLTPDQANALVLGRTYDPSKIYNGGKIVANVDGGNASNTVQGPASISELVRSLQNNAQYIFEWVYNNIDWEPGWGLNNGALGTILAGRGNAFDQTCLLVTLLEAAGYTANYVLGTIQLNAAAAGAWFGTDPTFSNESYCFYNEIPVQYILNPVTNQYDIQMSHVWVQCVISGTTYLFDPSYKTYTRKAPVANLGTILGYNSSTFYSSAETGATIDPSGNFVQNMNDANVRSNLATMSTNLATWIAANNPTANISDILGGTAIVPAVLPVLNTTLPYIVAGATQTVWTGTSGIPLAYKTTLEVSWSDGGIDQTFTTDQLAGGRLTIWWSGTTPTLYLNGTAVQTGTPVNYTQTYPTVIITHNAYSTFSENQSDFFYINTGESALIGSTFCNQGRGFYDYHQQQISVNTAAGNAAASEPVLGETLALLYAAYRSEGSAMIDLLDRFNHTKTSFYHAFSCVAFTGSVPRIDDRVDNLTSVGLDSSAPSSTDRAYSGPFSMLQNGFERAIFEQVTGTIPSVCTGELIRLANNAGTKIYQGTSANWSSVVSPALTAAGFTSAELTDMYDNYVNNDYVIEIPLNEHQVVGTWSGYGFYFWPTNNDGGPGGEIDGTSNGGAGGVTQTPGQLNGNGQNNGQDPNGNKGNGPTSDDPIDLFSGSYNYRQTDLSIGSQEFPYKLSFDRIYNSQYQYQNGILGKGWTHSFAGTATVSSDGFLAMGGQYALPAVAVIAAMYAMIDLCTTTADTQLPLDKHIIASLCGTWFMDQAIQNTVVLTLPEGSQTFTLLPNGSYAPPLNSASKLTLTSGLYTLTTPQGIKIKFNSSGQIASWVHPSGVTITYTYSSGLLQSVSNGIGRTLTLHYTSGVLTSVTDGTRTVSYGYDSNDDLTQFTDARSNITKYSYDQPGRMTQVFRPQNPTTALVTNVYDSLSRVKTQQNALSQTWTYYFAGSRSEQVDPVSNATVWYWNDAGAPTRYIDPLGHETDYLYDGINRLIQKTMPEGNQTQWIYDSNNNVLTTTFIAKSGSGLANVTNVFTYDPTWAKVKTAKDGKGNVTTYTYDTTLSNLVKVQLPVVAGATPTLTNTYNARGQLLSAIDETGIQTQYNYDTTTEKLLSKVVNTNWLATIGGTITVGNVLTLTAHDTSLTGGQEAVTYTVKSGDTLTSMATGLAAAVNADTKLAAVGIIAYSSSAVLSLSTAKGNATTFTESVTTGGTETITLAAGLNLTWTYGYDTMGNTNSVENANNNTTAYVFNNNRQLTQKTDPTPFSYVTLYGYDLNGNMLTQQRQATSTPTYQTYTWTYTLSDKKHTLTDPASHETTWNYDTKDRLANVIDAQSREYKFAYDALDRIYQITDPTTTIFDTRTYTVNGWLYQRKDARGNTTTLSYDGFDRLNETLYADSSYEQNVLYDSNGNVLTYRTRSGNTIVSTYDALNRLSTKAPTGQATATYNYDLNGRKISSSTPVVSGNPATGMFTFGYDTAGRFYKESTPDGKTTTSGLDSLGNLTKLTYPDGYYVSRVYDQLNRLTDVKLNGATSSAVHITYDELSRRAVLTYGNGATSTYTFQLNEDLTTLAEAFVGSSVSFTYGFNNVHQETSRSVTDNTYLWYPSAAATTTYGTATTVNEYPTIGSASCTYDGNANLKSNGTWTYTYDTENHLISASETGTSVSYVYDADHRQVQKTVGSTESRYVYFGWRRIADYNGATNALLTRYVYGTGLDEALLQVSSAAVVTYQHMDRAGSVIALTNSSGAVTAKSALSPFGEGTPPSGTTFGFTGQRYDSESGLYYYKRRYYNPAIGRFLQTDPVPGLNLYAYVQNDPLDLVDPYGLMIGSPNPSPTPPPVAPGAPLPPPSDGALPGNSGGDGGAGGQGPKNPGGSTGPSGVPGVSVNTPGGSNGNGGNNGTGNGGTGNGGTGNGGTGNGGTGNGGTGNGGTGNGGTGNGGTGNGGTGDGGTGGGGDGSGKAGSGGGLGTTPFDPGDTDDYPHDGNDHRGWGGREGSGDGNSGTTAPPFIIVPPGSTDPGSKN